MNSASSRQPVSAVIIAKNAAREIEDCLRSIDWVDEIVVVDSGSTDGTQELARSFGAQVFEYPDWPGFGPQRQRAQLHVSNDWLFMIDVDERVSAELRTSIEKVLENPDPAKVYCFSRLSEFFGRMMYRSGWYPDKVARFYHRDHFHYDDAQVHEKVSCQRVDQIDLDGDLLHFTTPDYPSFAAKSVRYACDWAQARFQRGKRTSIAGIVLHVAGCFLRKYVMQLGVLEGRHGFMLACVSSVYTFNKYAALWALQQRTLQQRESA